MAGFTHLRFFIHGGDSGETSCSTQPATNGGFLALQGQIVYNLPITLTGLNVGSVTGSVAPLRWNAVSLTG